MECGMNHFGESPRWLYRPEKGLYYIFVTTAFNYTFNL